MDHGEVERAEVLVEREISKIVVNVEEESIFEVLRRLSIRDPVKFVCKN